MSEDEENNPPSPKQRRVNEMWKKGKSRAPGDTEQAELQALIKEVVVDVIKVQGGVNQTVKESQGLSPSGTGENQQSQLLGMRRAHELGCHTWWPGVHWWSVAGVRYSHAHLAWPKMCSSRL